MAHTNQFMERFIRENPVAQETVEHFSSVLWMNKYLQDASYEVIETYSRHLKESGEDFFFSKTINTSATIPYCLTLRSRDLQMPPVTTSRPGPMVIPDHKHVTVVPEKPDCVFLISLGKSGLDGHPNVLHGGIACALLDETMGLMVMFHHSNVADVGPRDLLFTANLNVSFRAQIPTPAEILVKAWLVKREKRKWYSTGQIIDKNGTILSEGSALWLIADSKL